MNLLIVDDERIAVDSLLSMLNWNALGFTGIYSANNARQAMEIFLHREIDILLCDIEMPQISGLELLEWVRTYHPQTASIIVTCHASFDYARDALRMGSLEYILKPLVPDDMERAIASTIARVNSDMTQRENNKLAQYWSMCRPVIIEHFWQDIALRHTAADPQAILAVAREYNVPYDPSALYTPLVLRIQNARGCDGFVRTQTEYSVRSDITAGLKSQDIISSFFSMERGLLGGIVPDAGESAALLRAVQRAIGARDNSCHLCCYIGSPCSAQDVAAEMDRLRVRLENDVTSVNRAFLLEEAEPSRAADCHAPPDIDMQTWPHMIQQGQLSTMIAQINDYFLRLQMNKNLNRQVLSAFRYDFEQLLAVTMRSNEINARDVFGNEDIQPLGAACTDSLSLMMDWVTHTLTKIALIIQQTKEENPVIEEVKRYIGENLGTELHRRVIASQVYLCPDYLDRLFKKQTGMSVNKYILQRRMRRAQELLGYSGMSIGMISSMVGYVNISNFSVFFKRYTGMSPNQYRKQMRFKGDVQPESVPRA